MKVIKEGKIPVKQIECEYCHSMLEYDENDINKQEYAWEGGKAGRHKGYYENITCPICNKTIRVGQHETSYISRVAIQHAYKAGIII